jgi:hypothetical protein
MRGGPYAAASSAVRLNGRYCDVAITAPSGLDIAGVTGPYFRSGYYIVYRKDSGLNLSSLADTTFRRLRIGVHILNSDAENTPPAMAMSTYGVVGEPGGLSHQLQRHVPARRHLQGPGQ